MKADNSKLRDRRELKRPLREKKKNKSPALVHTQNLRTKEGGTKGRQGRERGTKKKAPMRGENVADLSDAHGYQKKRSSKINRWDEKEKSRRRIGKIERIILIKNGVLMQNESWENDRKKKKKKNVVFVGGIRKGGLL